MLWLLACAAFAAAWWLWASRHRTDAPGPPPLPLLGNVLQFRKLPVVVGHLRELHRRYGDVFRFYLGTKLVVVVTRPEDAQKVLTSSQRREPFFTRPIMTAIKDGLLTNHGEKWKVHRKVIEPAFRREVVNSFVDQFNRSADTACQHLQQTAGSETSLYQVFFNVAVQSLVESSFGISVSHVLPEDVPLAQLGDLMTSGLQFVSKRMYRPWLWPDWTLFLTQDGRRMRQYVKFLHDVMKRGTKLLEEMPAIEGPKKKLVLADVLLSGRSGQWFSQEEIIDEACTFLLAGSDTSAVTIPCALTLLGLYPEWQERVVQELWDVYGKGPDRLRSSTVQDLDQLPLLESVIKETMRLYATVPAGPYLMEQELKVGTGQYLVPSGSCAMVAYCLLHRQPDLFPDPECFNPSRFLEGGSAANRHPFSYLPFGGGLRKCPGYRYAMVQMKVVLSAVLRHFQVLPGSTREQLEEGVMSTSAQPITGYRATFVPRIVI